MKLEDYPIGTTFWARRRTKTQEFDLYVRATDIWGDDTVIRMRDGYDAQMAIIDQSTMRGITVPAEDNAPDDLFQDIFGMRDYR